LFDYNKITGGLSFASGEKAGRMLPSETPMCRIPVDEFISGSKVPYHLFVKLSDAKFFKFVNQGDALEISRVKALKGKGVTHFFMKHEDYVRYTGIILNLARVAENNPEIRARRIELMDLAGRLLQEQMHIKELQPSARVQMTGFICDTVEALSQSNNLLDLFSSMVRHSQSRFGSTLLSGVCALLICKGLKWDTISTKSRILMAVLLHDIGEKELPEEIVSMSRAKMTFDERKTYESHTVRGFDILKSIPEIPYEIAQVALQHHEDCQGYGFPNALKGLQISSLAKLTALSDEFCSRLLSEVATVKEGPISGLKVFYQLVKDKGPLFDREYLDALEEVLTSKT
jgi:HD-GYP domain-containing protein (c-di-GMP phosphodiesterase class II)